MISETGYGLNKFGKRLDELRITDTGEILDKKTVLGTGIQKQEKMPKRKQTREELRNHKRSTY
jgi:hypothetical protein